MRPQALLIAFGLLSGCWTENARPARPSAPEPSEPTAESSYRSVTIAVDAIGVAAMAVGIIGIQRGHNEDLNGGLLVAGLATAGYVTPIIHLAHGKRARAGGSFLVRSFAASTGTIAGLAAGCPDDHGQFFCGLTGMLWGVAGGLAVGGAIDAIYFHDDGSARSWMPTVTAGEGDARLGVIGSF